jgi:hypothetical protein
MRSNLIVRVPRAAIPGLSETNGLQAAALLLKGRLAGAVGRVTAVRAPRLALLPARGRRGLRPVLAMLPPQSNWPPRRPPA